MEESPGRRRKVAGVVCWRLPASDSYPFSEFSAYENNTRQYQRQNFQAVLPYETGMEVVECVRCPQLRHSIMRDSQVTELSDAIQEDVL